MSNLTAWGDSSSVPYVVQLGTWTNWSRGRIMGATLTVSRTNGNYLLSFTAFFISLVSVRFWRILCFVLHSRLATPAPRDALHHQRQALLRNANSATSSSWALVRLAWAWRGTAGRRLLARTLPLILTAALCAAAFTVAGGFSSQISTGIGNEVLVDGARCAITYTQGFNSSASNLMTLYVADQQLTANNYAQQCYNANATDYTFDCASFVTPALPSTVDYNAPCPFAPEICRSNTSNIRLDTGYLDTTRHLGVNAPGSERILFRSIFQCAPLVTENHTEHVTTPDGANYTRHYYGPPANSAAAHNWTYETPTLESVYSTYTQSDVDPFSGRGRNFMLPSVKSP